jgi:hypothetical protein
VPLVACPHYHLGLTDRVSRPLGLLSRIHIFRHGLLTGRVLNNLTEFRGHETELRAAIAARPVDSAVVPRDGISMPPPPRASRSGYPSLSRDYPPLFPLKSSRRGLSHSRVQRSDLPLSGNLR